ncbi:NAD(P)/FAD-dependent oxidoreductase [Pleurocapsales cyanobacterium LEGE 06147]|nr:NAD(P)/FAD-dependent oxidoreductase [Pleurocapsales cyanobacterium LEGE 06147]
MIIGGGAAGFFGAIACADANPNLRITLLEAARKPLAKVRISGGGRCNVTHRCFEPAQLIQNYPRGSKALRGAFTRFQPKDTIAWFEARGVRLKTESDGRMFPVTDDSETIVNCLLQTARDSGVKLLTGVSVVDVKKQQKPGRHEDTKIKFEVKLKNGEILECDRLLIATGSNRFGYHWAKDLGHTIEPPVPSLFTFNIKDSRLQNLAGISVDNVRVRLLETGQIKLEQTGALLITHWGVSGPAILKLSAWGARVLHDNNYIFPLQINWLSQYNRETLRQHLSKIKTEVSKKKIFGYCPVDLPKRLWQNLINFLEIDQHKSWAELGKKELNQLVQELIQGRYQITGKGVFKEEFVTCGGVNLKEINFKTMESKICPGLYFAGEILDIDGVTGGFNFQSAWTTGWIAGNAMAVEHHGERSQNTLRSLAK